MKLIQLPVFSKRQYDREVFGDHIVEILVDSKYRRSKDGKIEGYGIKVLP